MPTKINVVEIFAEFCVFAALLLQGILATVYTTLGAIETMFAPSVVCYDTNNAVAAISVGAFCARMHGTSSMTYFSFPFAVFTGLAIFSLTSFDKLRKKTISRDDVSNRANAIQREIDRISFDDNDDSDYGFDNTSIERLHDETERIFRPVSHYWRLRFCMLMVTLQFIIVLVISFHTSNPTSSNSFQCTTVGDNKYLCSNPGGLNFFSFFALVTSGCSLFVLTLSHVFTSLKDRIYTSAANNLVQP